jgi:PAS domain S-box-containing protein
MKKESLLIDWISQSALSIDQKIALIDKVGCDAIRFGESNSNGLIWFNGYLPDEIREEVRSILERLMVGDPDVAEQIKESAITLKEVKKIIAWTNMILTSEDGATIGSLSSGKDISSQVQLEKAQYEQDKNFRSMYEDASDAILVLQDGKLRYANKKVAEISGYSPRELIDKNFQELVDLGRKEKTPELEKDYSEEGGGFQEYKLIAKNGRCKSVQLYMISTTWDGRVAAIVFIRSVHTD